MNQLLANYDAARKAIFDHCGVPESQRYDGVYTDGRPWFIEGNRTLVIPDIEKGNGYCHVRESIVPDHDIYGKSIYVGQSVTMCLIDQSFSDESPDEYWLDLDNAMEVKL